MADSGRTAAWRKNGGWTKQTLRGNPRDRSVIYPVLAGVVQTLGHPQPRDVDGAGPRVWADLTNPKFAATERLSFKRL